MNHVYIITVGKYYEEGRVVAAAKTMNAVKDWLKTNGFTYTPSKDDLYDYKIKNVWECPKWATAKRIPFHEEIQNGT